MAKLKLSFPELSSIVPRGKSPTIETVLTFPELTSAVSKVAPKRRPSSIRRRRRRSVNFSPSMRARSRSPKLQRATVIVRRPKVGDGVEIDFDGDTHRFGVENVETNRRGLVTNATIQRVNNPTARDRLSIRGDKWKVNNVNMDHSVRFLRRDQTLKNAVDAAVVKNDTEEIGRLLNNGADPNYVLEVGAKRDNLALLDLAYEAGATNYNSAMKIAVNNGSMAFARVIAEATDKSAVKNVICATLDRPSSPPRLVNELVSIWAKAK